MRNIEFVISVVLTVGTAFIVAIWVPTPDHDPMKKVQLAIAYGMEVHPVYLSVRRLPAG